MVLKVDMPSHGLKTGEIGAVAQVYPEDAVEVEFVTASGRKYSGAGDGGRNPVGSTRRGRLPG